jgi:hypothetical protein
MRFQAMGHNLDCTCAQRAHQQRKVYSSSLVVLLLLFSSLSFLAISPAIVRAGGNRVALVSAAAELRVELRVRAPPA